MATLNASADHAATRAPDPLAANHAAAGSASSGKTGTRNRAGADVPPHHM